MADLLLKSSTTFGPPLFSDGAGDLSIREAAPTYTPLVAEDFSGGSLGATYPGWKSAASIYDNTRAYDGSQSLKVITDTGQAPVACGGDTYCGGHSTLPEVVPIGKTIWYRARVYIPTAFSWGYVFNSSDSAEAATCSQPSDGNGLLKFMRLAPVTGTARIYMQPQVARRSVAQPVTNITRVISEAGPTFEDFDNAAGKIALDQWVALQMAVKVADDGTGFIRYWVGDTFIGEATGQTVSAGNSLDDWGLINYWNGVPYTDGLAGREDMWMDDIIIASDIAGRGAPNTLDSGGRPFISESTTVGDF
jgi:hypothetical protein